MPRFRPQQRLRSAADYRSVFQQPDARVGRRELLVLARANALPHHRLGLAIAKKHIPLAVNRNRIKRVAREQFRHLAPAHPGLDIVILTRPGADGADKAAIKEALQRLFQRLGLEIITP